MKKLKGYQAFFIIGFPMFIIGIIILYFMRIRIKTLEKVWNKNLENEEGF